MIKLIYLPYIFMCIYVELFVLSILELKFLDKRLYTFRIFRHFKIAFQRFISIYNVPKNVYEHGLNSPNLDI